PSRWRSTGNTYESGRLVGARSRAPRSERAQARGEDSAPVRRRSSVAGPQRWGLDVLAHRGTYRATRSCIALNDGDDDRVRGTASNIGIEHDTLAVTGC